MAKYGKAAATATGRRGNARVRKPRGAPLERMACEGIIKRMIQRFSGEGKLWDVVRERQKHYYRDVAVDPPMLTGYEGHARQVTILRDTLIEARARLCENEWKVEVSPPKPGAKLAERASRAEMALGAMFEDIETQSGVNIQGALVDGLYRDCYGVLHWYLADGAMQAASVDLDETSEGYALERQIARASATPCWAVEVIPATQFAFVADKSAIGGFKYGLTAQVIPCIDWVGSADPELFALTERGVGTEVVDGSGAREYWTPSADVMEKEVTLYKLWSAEYCYELVVGAPPGVPESAVWRVIPNRQGMVPFALALGAYTHHDDVVYAYEPVLASVYSLKPALDRYVANMGALAESGAIRKWVLQPIDGAAPPLTDDTGHVKVFSGSAIEGLEVPEGYTLREVGGDGISGDYARLGDLLFGQLKDALPNTGIVPIEGVSGPAWTMRQAIQQANVEPAMYVGHLTRCLLSMVRNMVDVMGDEVEGPGDVSFYPTRDGDVNDGSAVITIAPEEWTGLAVGVSIGVESATERVSLMQHGVEMWQAGYLSQLDVIRDYERQPNAEDVYAARKVEQYCEANIDPGLMREAAAEWGGTKFALAPGGMVDAMGQQVTPQQVLQANGVTPVGQVNQSVGSSEGAMGAVQPELAVPGRAPGGVAMGQPGVSG